MKKIIFLVLFSSSLFANLSLNNQLMFLYVMTPHVKNVQSNEKISPNIKYIGVFAGVAGLIVTVLAFRKEPKKYINGKLNPRYLDGF